jgi:beta-glucosidase
MKKYLILTFISLLLLELKSQTLIKQPYQPDKKALDFVQSLLNKMTLDEKIGQMTLFTSDWDVTGPTIRANYQEDIKSGKVGSIFNAHTAEYTRKLQKIAVEQTRLKIPLLFGYDVIHGHKTIFPIPLAESCTWDMALIEKNAHYSAKEAAASGLHWTFNPMVDVARDPRWGRVSEGSGEDTYLGSLIAQAKVKGYQGNNLQDPFTILACVKHFAAYGAAQAGRDYHTVDMSERVLRETYLPPFKAAIDAGCFSVMTSFNEYDGVPASGNSFLLQKILRQEWNFKGLVVTDYTSMNEMVPHGIVADQKAAGELALNAGVDLDMQGAVYYNYLKKSLAEGKITERQINEAVKNVLLAKYELGLFTDPYRYSDLAREKNTIFSPEIMNQARVAAQKSIVLLKNEPFRGKKILPLTKNIQKVALIGPLANNQEDMLGNWRAAGDISKAVTILQGIKEALGSNAEVKYAKGCDFSSNDTQGFEEAIALAKNAEVVILAMGENQAQSGEAASRSELGLPGAQQQLVEAILKIGKPVVILLGNGRPLTIPWLAENAPCILETWHLGTMAGKAIADVLFGDYNPSGKLTMTFPRSVGQIPIFYNPKNTGRPFNAQDKYTSKYLDVSNEPLFPFGFGLSYTDFSYQNMKLNKNQLKSNDEIEVSIEVKNIGNMAGEEIVQLYVQDLVGSVTRPVKELKGFQKILLQAGETKTVSFKLKTQDLAFYTQDMSFKPEAGKFKLMIGANSAHTQDLVLEVLD